MLSGCAAFPAGSTAFGLLGDTPYNEDEVRRLERLIDEMNAGELAFVVHVGDIGNASQSCTDAGLEARRQQFARIRAPFILLPGDNEWSDCRQPLERLARWRHFFCGAERIVVERQPGEYCEHIRWRAAGWVFVALNVQGSNNNVRHAEHAKRMEAVYAWLEDSARVAAEAGEGLAVLMQANPFVVVPRDGYAGLRERLAALPERLRFKVALIHGDTHLFRDDEPLPGLRRIEVFGSPFVSWIPAAVVDGRLEIRRPRLY
ncbi:MAG: metallophosphoesterase family protein [Betaproteobacteria bacterium]